MIHIGSIIKQILDARGMKATELARRINMSNANTHHIFNRASIDTTLLISIGEALNYNFFKHYDQHTGSESPSVQEYSEAYGSDKNKMFLSITVNNIPLHESQKILNQLNKIIK